MLPPTKHQEALISGLSSVTNILQTAVVRQDMYFDNASVPPHDNYIRATVELYSCIFEYQIRVFNYVSQKSGKRWIKSVVQADDWPAMREKVFSAEQKCKSLMHLTDTQEVRRRRAQDEKKQALLQDLATASNYKTDKNFVSARTTGTCEWFFEDQTFQQWRECPESSLLWVTAGPGCGKSVLARALIDEGRVSKNVVSSTVCYFFFKDSQERRTQSTHALGALLHQLFQDPDLIKHGLASHRNHGKSLLEAFDDMWEILLKVANDPDAGEIVCVIDALDECEQTSRLQLLDRIIAFYSQPDLKTTSTVLKFLITSRPYEDLDDRFQHLRNVSNYVRCDGDEHSQQIGQEINIVIDAEIKDILPNHSQSDQTLIANRMKSRGNRTYLWLFLTIDIIKSSRSKYRKISSIEGLMNDLPIQIADAYEKILSRSSDEILARKLLQIIVAAREPLSLEEANIALALATQPACDSLDGLDLWPSEDFAADIKKICGLLVTCYDDKIALIHQTAREFLLRPSGPAKADQKPLQGSFESTEADELMTEICTTYLLALDPGQVSQRTGYYDWRSKLGRRIKRRQDFQPRFPLLRYSAQHWASHYRNQTHFMGKSHDLCFQRALKLCDTEALHCDWWLLYVEGNTLDFPRNARSSLLLAVYQGLDDLIKANLGQNSDKGLDWLNDHDSGYTHGLPPFFDSKTRVWAPPLHLATHRGRLSTVKTLLDFGADINIEFGGRRPLHIASANGHGDLVKLLLNNGADVNAFAGRKIQTNSLCSAIQFRHSHIIDVLLKHGADVNARAFKKSWTAFTMAVSGVDIRITKLLLDHKADTELNGGPESCTPLQQAVLELNFEMTRLLLQCGADVNAKSANFVSAMHIASHMGQKHVMELLLDAGADIDARADINAGADVNAGADINARENFLGTPLWLAALENHPRTVKFLLDHGADPNISLGPFGTPLGVAKRQDFHDIVDIFVTDEGTTWNGDESEVSEPSIKLEIPRIMQKYPGKDLRRR